MPYEYGDVELLPESVNVMQARPLTFNITAVATSAVQPTQPQSRAPMREPVLVQLTRPHQCHNCLPDAHALPPHILAREVC